MTAPPTSPPSQPPPPAEQTTAAEPQPSTAAADVEPTRSQLVQKITERPEDPRPRSLATQEIRFALAFTGGVSLAVWMGGVARELNLLVQASERRRTVGRPEDATTPDDNAVRRFYRRLLDLVDAEVAIDVLAGTSAGGINAALLGLVNARALDLGPLRDIWLEAGDFGKLLRDPAEGSPPSLLKGDGQMLTALNDGISRLIDGQPIPRPPLATDVFITTTLLSPETSRFTDDYGTEIADTDHHGMFHFGRDELARDDVVAPLALAARSSASFPAAFEPSFLPFGQPAGADGRHPDMSPFSNATRAHWAADGGLLANRPIAPLLQRIFDRSADREVRRALLYVVPSSGAAAAGAADDQAKPLGLAAALQNDLGATLNQSIAADLAAIKEHNDRVGSAADTRMRMAALGNRLKDGERLTDAAAWHDYRERQGDWLTAPLVAEMSRQLTTLDKALPAAWAAVPGTDRDAQLRLATRDRLTRDWPGEPPPEDSAVETALLLGRPAYEGAKATLLRLLRLGTVLATDLQQRNFLADRGRYASRPLSDTVARPLRPLVERRLGEALRDWADPRTAGPELTAVVTTIAADYIAAQGDAEQLRAAWASLAETYLRSVGCLRALVDAAPSAEPDDAQRRHRIPLRRRRALVAAELGEYLDFVDGTGGADGVEVRSTDRIVDRFLELHVAVRSVLPVLTEVPQLVELIQVSADTRTALAPHHTTAASKLTGMQVHHFGAFYKPSWRANDWMWGRLDGCGWLVHVLLDPRRILAVLENDGISSGRAAEMCRRLTEALGTEVPAAQAGELSFLDNEQEAVPQSLPGLATWAASVLQERIAREELPVVVGLVRAGLERKKPPKDAPDHGYQGDPSTSGVGWLKEAESVDWSTAPSERVAKLLDSCPVGQETIAQEAKERTPLFVRTATQAAAVATAAGTGVGSTPTSLKPTFTTARTMTRTAYTVANQTRGGRRAMTLVGLALLVGGALALLTNVTVFGLAGLVIFGAGAIVLGFGVGPRTIDALRILLALALLLLLLAPWLPWLWHRVYPWLSGTAVPALDTYHWIWPVVLLLVFLPPASAVGDMLRRRRSRPGGGGSRRIRRA